LADKVRSVSQLKMLRGPTELFWHNSGGMVFTVFLGLIEF